MKYCIGLLMAVLLGACSTDPGTNPPGTLFTELPITLDRLEADQVLSGSEVFIAGSGFLTDASYEVTVEGTVSGIPLSFTTDATYLSDTRLSMILPPADLDGAIGGLFEGQLSVIMRLIPDEGRQSLPVSFELLGDLQPTIAQVPVAVFPASPIAIQGQGFIAGAEGRTLVDIEGVFRPEGEGRTVMVNEVSQLAEPPERLADRWQRDEIELVLDPAWVGIRPGEFEGRLRVINEGNGWSLFSEWIDFNWDLLPPVVQDVSPLQSSRGQRITLIGNGFVGGPYQGSTTVRLDGRFQPLDGEVSDLPPGGIELAPVWFSGTELGISYSVRYETQLGRCVSGDLGAVPGRVEGTVTPIVEWTNQRIEGTPTPIQFQVLPTRQVVWIKFLPAFTDSLRLFGLRNVSRLIQTRVMNVLRRDYEGINIEFRITEPTDYLSYSIVEVGGPDPNAAQLFGLDNTPGLDNCNQRLDDNLAGRNADSNGAFGGIFVESFLQLSPSRGNDNPLSSPRFDEIFNPIISNPVGADEFPGSDRDAAIEEAVYVLGNLIGNTVTHEIGHSLGLPVVAGCGQYHNAPGDSQIMDCGGDRPFEERAEIDGTPRAVFTSANRAYLEEILPVR
ncbi:MAG: hypothetical protein ACE366_05635 [Bradymonadia bacterium]